MRIQKGRKALSHVIEDSQAVQSMHKARTISEHVHKVKSRTGSAPKSATIHIFEPAGLTFSSRNLRQSSPEKLDEIAGSTSPLRSQEGTCIQSTKKALSVARSPRLRPFERPQQEEPAAAESRVVCTYTHSSVTVGVT